MRGYLPEPMSIVYGGSSVTAGYHSLCALAGDGDHANGVVLGPMSPDGGDACARVEVMLHMEHADGGDIRLAIGASPLARYQFAFLGGASGVVFVLDSRRGSLNRAARKLRRLREELAAAGRDPDGLPFVFQVDVAEHDTGRDAADRAPISEIQKVIATRSCDYVESDAARGIGCRRALERIVEMSWSQSRASSSRAWSFTGQTSTQSSAVGAEDHRNDPQIEALLVALERTESEEDEDRIRKLGGCPPDPRITSALQRCLEDLSRFRRTSVWVLLIGMLEEQGDPRGASVLDTLLADLEHSIPPPLTYRDPEIRRAAEDALGRLRSRLSAPDPEPPLSVHARRTMDDVASSLRVMPASRRADIGGPDRVGAWLQSLTWDVAAVLEPGATRLRGEQLDACTARAGNARRVRLATGHPVWGTVSELRWGADPLARERQVDEEFLFHAVFQSLRRLTGLCYWSLRQMCRRGSPLPYDSIESDWVNEALLSDATLFPNLRHLELGPMSPAEVEALLDAVVGRSLERVEVHGEVEQVAEWYRVAASVGVALESLSVRGTGRHRRIWVRFQRGKDGRMSSLHARREAPGNGHLAKSLLEALLPGLEAIPEDALVEIDLQTPDPEPDGLLQRMRAALARQRRCQHVGGVDR